MARRRRSPSPATRRARRPAQALGAEELSASAVAAEVAYVLEASRPSSSRSTLSARAAIEASWVTRI